MITRIEIDGFKTFQDFAVDLEPFQVIIGPNGCGKSNFFDALDLLSKIATSDLRTAFKSIRGDINELFTVIPEDKSADRMRFAVEMLTPYVEQIEQSEPTYLRMRYEVEITHRMREDGFEQLFVSDEHLQSLLVGQEKWKQKTDFASEKAALSNAIRWFVGSFDLKGAVVHEDGSRSVHTVPDLIERGRGNSYGYELNKGTDKVRATDKLFSETLLFSYSHDRYPQIQAAQKELQHLRLLRLDTNMLRKPSSMFDDPILTATGENLPATLARIQTLDKPLLKNVSRDVSSIVPNFAGIEVDRDAGQKRLTLYASMKDKRRFSVEALSEGTLRVLALAALRNDPQLQGTLCFEDPEAGVHPGAFERIVRMLRSMATDLNDPEDLKLPLRQILVTTHSPELVSHLNIEQGELLFADSVTRVVPGDAAWRVTRITPVCSDEEPGPAQTYALSKVIEYLKNPGTAEKQNSLREAMLR